MQERFHQTTHRGATIVIVDLSGLQDEREITRLLKARSGLQRPHGLLVDVTDTHVSPTSLQAAKGNAREVMSIIKATAVVGSGSMVGLMVRAVSRVSGMNIATFETRQEAMDWLAAELAKG